MPTENVIGISQGEAYHVFLSVDTRAYAIYYFVGAFGEENARARLLLNGGDTTLLPSVREDDTNPNNIILVGGAPYMISANPLTQGVGTPL